MSAIYRPPNQGSSTETITEHFPMINTNYFQFCFLYGLEQLMNHILTTFAKRVSQQDIIDVGLSKYIALENPHVGTHKQITFHLLETSTVEAYKEALSKVCFPI